MRIDYGLRIGIETGNCFRVSWKIPDKSEWYLRPHPISKHVQRIMIGARLTIWKRSGTTGIKHY